jgi:hypothetical protein
MQFKSAAEKADYYRQQKKEKERERKLKCYTKNKTNYNITKKCKRKPPKAVTRSMAEKSKSLIRVEKHRNMKEMKRRRNIEYQNQFKQRRTALVEKENSNYQFKNKMEKCRILKKIKECIPESPKTQKLILRTIASTPQNKQTAVDELIVRNVKDMITSLKRRRSSDALESMTVLTASVSGENISEGRVKGKTASRLGLRFNRITSGTKKRETVFRSEEACLANTFRKVRNDRITDDVKQKVYDWWVSSKASQPTGNKSDVKRKRIGHKTYLSHAVHIMLKTQSEIYKDFKTEYPDIKISQRVFERLKPFFVRQMRTKDRNTCCCRKHVECRLLFNKYKDLVNKNILSQPINTFDEFVNATMCPKATNSQYNSLECIQRKCADCGVANINVFSDENIVDNTIDISWERYEYITTQTKFGAKKKLQLVKKKTKAKEMLDYFKSQMETFTLHQFSANWQLDQLNSLKRCLPDATCLVIHDFSENYRCIDKDELQTSYFGKTEVSLHVSVIYRHAVAEYDGIDETNIISELFYTISPDVTHDHFFVTRVQEAIKSHLDSIGCAVSRMIEYTDGCSSQYKSKTCMGVCSYLCEKLGYSQFERNYFETSHAKGPQDAAGGLLKRQLDVAVMRGNSIQTAHDVYKFAAENLTEPKSGIYSRRIFHYITDIDRSATYSFKAVPQNRKVHQMTTSRPGKITVRDQSCYTCDNCLAGMI